MIFIDMIGASTFVVISSNYSSSAITCTCQDTGLIGLVYLHRRSCSLLQRNPEFNENLFNSVSSFITGGSYVTFNC